MINFVHPGFLYALFALIIPVILHLFSFRKYKKVYFSNFNFLQSLQQQKKNSSKLKNLLLLLLRIIALASIIIAFATPYATPDRVRRSTNIKPQVVIYIDNSFSMSNTGSKGNLLDEGKKHLYDIVNTYPAGTNFMLLTNDPTGSLTLGKDQVINALGGLKASPATKMLSTIFREAAELTARKPATLFLVSDFQKSNCDFQNVTPDSLIQPVFLLLNPENRNNLYIKEVSFAQAFHQKNQSDKIRIQIANSSPKEFNNVPVSLTINGRKKSASKVNLPADGETTLEISYLNTEEGFYKGVVEITDFPVVFDNKFYFSYATGGNIEILYIHQDHINPFFNKLFSDSTVFNITSTNVNQTANIAFNNYNLIILDRISTSWTGLESAMETYVTAGGNLFLLPGQKNSATALNRILGKMHAPLFESSDTSAILTHIENEAGLFRNVFEKQDENIVLPRAKTFWHLSNTGNSEKLIADKRGNPMLAVQSAGKGKIYLSAFDYAPENTDMVYHPLFIPVMVNMAGNINSGLSTFSFLNSGNPVNLNPKINTENGGLRIVSDDRTLEFIPEIRKDYSGYLVLANPQNIREAGLYSVMKDNETVDLLAFNYDRRESQLLFSDENELRKHFPNARIENIKTTQIDQNSQLIKEIVLQDNNKYLTCWFLLLGVVALLFEQIVWRKKLM